MAFEDMEINPMAAGLALVAGIIGVIVQTRVDTNIFFTVITFVATALVGYFVANKIANN